MLDCSCLGRGWEDWVRSGRCVDWVDSTWDDRSGNQWRYDSRDRGMGRSLNYGLDLGFWFWDMDDGQRIMDSIVSFIEAVDGSIGGWVNGDLAAIGNAFDGRGSNNVNFTVD
jgi:hypothetical protein